LTWKQYGQSKLHPRLVTMVSPNERAVRRAGPVPPLQHVELVQVVAHDHPRLHERDQVGVHRDGLVSPRGTG
jgi:hypothetical protein